VAGTERERHVADKEEDHETRVFHRVTQDPEPVPKDQGDRDEGEKKHSPHEFLIKRAWVLHRADSRLRELASAPA